MLNNAIYMTFLKEAYSDIHQVISASSRFVVSAPCCQGLGNNLAVTIDFYLFCATVCTAYSKVTL